MAVTPQAAPVARVRQLSQHYGDTLALDQLDLDIPAGQMVGLLGPDGVGKSSLLAILAGARQIQQAANGKTEVTVLGANLAKGRRA